MKRKYRMTWRRFYCCFAHFNVENAPYCGAYRCPKCGTDWGTP